VPFPGLASLSSLRLAGNPVAYARSYRCDVLSCFPPPQQHAMRLDGAPPAAAAGLHRWASNRRHPMRYPLDSKQAHAAHFKAVMKHHRFMGVSTFLACGAAAVLVSVGQAGALGDIRRGSSAAEFIRRRTSGAVSNGLSWLVQVCSTVSQSEEGDRPQWLASDGQAWARLVDEVLGPAKARVTRQVPPITPPNAPT
jgi:hypothetical protein